MANPTPVAATLQTLSVSIRMLTVGPKQMTLAVFRQLENEQLYGLRYKDAEGEPFTSLCAKTPQSGGLDLPYGYGPQHVGDFDGVPWGWINHHWKGCWRGATEECLIETQLARLLPHRYPNDLNCVGYGDDDGHYHVVWSAGDQLRKAVVPARVYGWHPILSALPQLFIGG